MASWMKEVHVFDIRRGFWSGWGVKSVQFDMFEPSCGKTNNVVSKQVRHKPACTSTEKS